MFKQFMRQCPTGTVSSNVRVASAKSHSSLAPSVLQFSSVERPQEEEILNFYQTLTRTRTRVDVNIQVSFVDRFDEEIISHVMPYYESRRVQSKHGQDTSAYKGAYVSIRFPPVLPTPTSINCPESAHIFIHNDTPAPMKLHLIAHELAHIQLFAAHIDPRCWGDPERPLTKLELTCVEGLCEHMSAEYLKSRNSATLDAYVHEVMYAASDPVYGVGLRSVDRAVRRWGTLGTLFDALKAAASSRPPGPVRFDAFF